MWHVAWTRGQNDPPLQIGCAKSKDLVQCSEARREWLIFWAATVPGRFADTDGSGGSGYNRWDGTVVKTSEAQAKALQAR